MKILKILGIVAGLHAFALLLIFANPGCSSAGQPMAAAEGPAAKPTVHAVAQAAPPMVSIPPVVTVPGSAEADPGTALRPAPLATGPAAAPSDSDAQPMIRYSPTRPGTTVAAALEAQPVENVTPASTYTVEKGDSLWTVAKKNHLTVNDLALANKLKAGATLKVGQKLILPAKSGALTAPAVATEAARGPAAAPRNLAAPPAAPAAPAASPPGPRSAEATRHVVKPGETLGAIARRYGVKVSDIDVANNITDPKRIHPGQELIIPGKQAAAPKATGVKTINPVPGPDQDLDAGVKPASPGEVPVIKVDDSAAPPPGKP